MTDLEFEEFARVARRRLRSYVISRGTSYEDASDMVSEALVRIWKHRDEIVGDAYNYACRVCSRLIVDALRSRGRRPLVYSVEDLEIGEGLELYDCVDGNNPVPFNEPEFYLPEGLSHADKELLCAWANGMGQAEIGKRLGEFEGTIRSKMYRARRRARTLIGAKS